MQCKDSDLSKGTVVFDHKNNYRCCGIQYKKWVLTSGLILCPYVSPDDLGLIQNEQCWTFNEDDDNNIDKQLFLSEIDDNIMKKISKKKFKVLLKDHTENQYVDYRKTLCKGTNLDLNINSNDNISTVDSYTAHPLTVFRSDIVNHYVQDHFSDWQLCSSQDQFDDISSDLIQNLLSVFLILQIGDTDEIYDNQIPLNYFLRLTNNENYMRRGLDIIVESTPFAIPQFFNTWSRGIISNTIDHTGCLFYTDTRLVIGCVGAPVYRYKQGNNKGGLLGMILNPMLWSQGEWAGFSVAVDLHIILKEVIHDKNPIHRNYFNALKNISTHKLIEDLDKSVVLVRCNHNWGSGVVVNKKHGIIITCAHVVNYLEEQTVKIECGSFKTTAKVIYCNKPGEVFDIAVLNSEPLFNSKEVSLTNEPPVKGETVFCVGYPMVDTSQVTLSKGIIANVEPDTFIQTTCCVQSGASGGAIIRPSGVLVGIPVSNMSCASTHALYPHCNLSIPATVFADALTKYFTTKDITCLKKLTSRNPHVQQKWLLQHKCKI